MKREKLILGLALACALFSVANATYAAWWCDVTWDEPAHLTWSSRLFHDGKTERLSQPDFDSKTPILVPHVAFASAFGAHVDDLHTPRTMFLHRVPSVIALALLYLAIYLIGRRLFGAEVGALALALSAADPNLLAHGSLATVDAIFALTTLLALAGSIAFWRKPRLGTGALAGAALGLALMTKFTALLLLPVCIVAPPLIGLRPDLGPGGALIRSVRVVGALLVGAIAAWLVIASSYGFIGLGAAVTQHSFLTSSVRGLVAGAPHLFALFPVDYLSGIDICLSEERQTSWNSVLLGTYYPNGVWFYFPVCWALKTPVPLLVVSVLGGFSLVRSGALKVPAVRVLTLALAILVAYFCFVFRTDKGYRYVLMCLPIAYLLVAGGIDSWSPRLRAPIAAVALLMCFSTAFRYRGDPLAYTNAFIWNKAQIYRYLTDSNIDWLQTRRHIDAWLAEHPGVAFNPPHLVAGRNLVGVDEWTGVIGDAARRQGQYAPLRGVREPNDVLYYTHLVFDVTSVEFERILERQRRTKSVEACPLGGAPAMLANADTALVVPREGIVCIEPDDGQDHTDVAFTALEDPGGAIAVATDDPKHPLLAEDVKNHNADWHRIGSEGLVLYTRGTPFALRAHSGHAKVRIGDAHEGAPAHRTIVPCAGGREARTPEGAPAPLYLVGTFGDWRAWGHTQLHYDAGCYTVTLRLLPGTHSFKIAGPEWDQGASYSIFGEGPNDYRVFAVNEIGPLIQQTDVKIANNIAVTVPASGRYRFELRIDKDSAAIAMTPAEPH